MPNTITLFDTKRHHIHVKVFVTHPTTKTRHSFDGIVDTGAPKTEFADIFLNQTDFIENVDAEVKIKPGLQTQKYGKIVLPEIEICGHTLRNFEVIVSRLDKSWGIAVLIGLDFFRRFRTTVDYGAGQILTEPL